MRRARFGGAFFAFAERRSAQGKLSAPIAVVVYQEIYLFSDGNAMHACKAEADEGGAGKKSRGARASVSSPDRIATGRREAKFNAHALPVSVLET